MRRDIQDLGQQMRTLHEDVIGRIAAIPGCRCATEVADLEERTGRRLDPLEAVVRQHDVEIRQHGVAIEKLKPRRR